jgi:hypothetical protein
MNHALGVVFLRDALAALAGTIPLTFLCRQIVDLVLREMTPAREELPLQSLAGRSWTGEDERMAEASMKAHP